MEGQLTHKEKLLKRQRAGPQTPPLSACQQLIVPGLLSHSNQTHEPDQNFPISSFIIGDKIHLSSDKTMNVKRIGWF